MAQSPAGANILSNNVWFQINSITFDAWWRLRVSWLTTLFDGKTLDADNTNIWDNVATGTASWGNNKYSMAVASWEYCIRQAKRFSPYFSGKSQFIEITTIDFDTEANVTKRAWYFSSAATGSYNATYDWFWIEDNGTTKILKASRAGTETISVNFADMDNYAAISSYNWEKFTVFAFDFLWLGGAILRFFVKTSTGFELIHTVNYSGTASDIFILSPNQPIRYEIRSSTGTGNFVAVCSQVSTEWSINEEWYNWSINTGSTGIALASIGTTYPLLAIRKKTAYRDISAKVTGISYFVSSANDQILWTLQLNPTLSAWLTYAGVDWTGIERAVGNWTITVSSAWRILASWYLTQNSIIDPEQFDRDYLAYLGIWLDNTQYALVLCGTPVTASVTSFGVINFKEFAN